MKRFIKISIASIFTSLFFIFLLPSVLNLGKIVFSSNSKSLENNIPQNANMVACKKSNIISNCQLLPGDILLRRDLHVPATRLRALLFHLYFSHSAIYIGDGKIVEARGYEINHKVKISIRNIRQSEWANKKIESWAVIGPKASKKIIESIVKNAKYYGTSPNIKFGISFNKNKDNTIYCSKLVWKVYKKSNYPIVQSGYKIISPDELFLLLIKDPNHFNVVGYSINK